MKKVITAILILTCSLVEAQVDPLEGYHLYKVEQNEVAIPNGVTGSILYILGNFGSEALSDNPFTGGPAYVADLNGDGLVNTGDLTILMGVYGQTIWELDPECEDTLYNCFLLSFPGTYWSTSWFPGQPYIGINTAVGTYWWVQN